MTAAATLTRRDTGLVWGLKESFLAYVAGCPDGSVELSPGTGQLPDGSFYFSPDPDAPAAALHFRGGVRLRAHGGMLDVSLADPRVEGTDGRLLLTAETWKDGVWQRIPFADVSWAPAVGGAESGAGGGAGTDGGGSAGAGSAAAGAAGGRTAGGETAAGVAARDGAVRTLPARTRLHSDATALFDDMYAAGEVLSLLMVRVPLDVPSS
ncbi:HtaA domain-containing protein [Arthrobacter koreensis]|uniref:HtaA domain-containing protein n=1 Tax=Arthrobacter koreensis TaxID=199136 RepID=UPI000B1E3221|nr:HtaA domain-containing protein [Arthrobacter koreensis]